MYLLLIYYLFTFCLRCLFVYLISLFTSMCVVYQLYMYIYMYTCTSTCTSILYIYIYIYCTLRGRIKGAASAISVMPHSLHGGARNTARHVITVIVVAFLTQENKAVICKVQ